MVVPAQLLISKLEVRLFHGSLSISRQLGLGVEPPEIHSNWRMIGQWNRCNAIDRRQSLGILWLHVCITRPVVAGLHKNPVELVTTHETQKVSVELTCRTKSFPTARVCSVQCCLLSKLESAAVEETKLAQHLKQRSFPVSCQDRNTDR